jgi:hypothetical protein
MSGKILPFRRPGQPARPLALAPEQAAAALRQEARACRIEVGQRIHEIHRLEQHAESLERVAARTLGEGYEVPPRTFPDPYLAMVVAVGPQPQADEDACPPSHRAPLPEWLLDFPPPDDEPRNPCA